MQRMTLEINCVAILTVSNNCISKVTGYDLQIWRCPIHCDHYWSTVLPHLSSNHSSFNHQSSLAVTSRHLVAKREKLGEECPWILPTSTSFMRRELTCRKILRYRTDGFTCPPKEVVLRSFISVKNPSSSFGFEPANLGSNGKHDNH
jgi:hypothetical protein